MRIAGDHADYEELIEVCPFGVDTDARWHVYLTPSCMVCVEDLDDGANGALEFRTLDSALSFIGGEIDADVMARAGNDPCGWLI
jgi:hypothetical protein